MHAREWNPFKDMHGLAWTLAAAKVVILSTSLFLGFMVQGSGFNKY